MDRGLDELLEPERTGTSEQIEYALPAEPESNLQRGKQSLPSPI